MHIERLELKNYTGFEDFSLDFPKGNLTVFIGENGSGKTSILEAIYYLIESGDFKQYEFLNKKLYINKNNENEKNLFLSIKLKNRNNQSIITSIQPWITEIADGMYNRESEYINEDGSQIKLTMEHGFYSNLYRNGIASFYTYLSKPFSYKIENFINWYRDLFWHSSYIKMQSGEDYLPKKALDEAIYRFSGIKISTKKLGHSTNDLQTIFHKNGIELPFESLSQGEQKTINIIGQIIYILAPELKEGTDDILSFYGIVLIDEIETHLHPRWQREILPNLTKTFPNVQFIVTTHSPQVISSVPKEAVFLLKDFKAIPVQSFTQGRDSNALLTEVFDVPERPEGAMALLANFYQSINEKKAAAAEKYLQEMRLSWGELDSEVIKATWDFEELLNEREEEIA